MAYYNSRPDSPLDAFQLRYFEVTVSVNLVYGSQASQIEFCPARSILLHEPLGRYRILPKIISICST